MKDKKLSADEDWLSTLKQATKNPVVAPKQMIVKMKETALKTKFTFHLPTEKYNKLKILAVNRSSQDNKVFLQDLINDALDRAYFNEKL